VCEHCGCRGVQPIAQLMDEHLALLDIGGEIRRHLDTGDRRGAWELLARLAHDLGHHVDREERGLFQALKAQGDFTAAVAELEGEHADFDEALSDLGLEDGDLEARVEELLDHLSVHIDKENLGIFPVAVVTLGATGWDAIAAVHQEPAHTA
jgi:hemerythrin-like domain-containing protein